VSASAAIDAVQRLRIPQGRLAGGSARAVTGLVEALAKAKEAGLTPEALRPLFAAVDWREIVKPAE